jgi:hypothetical protein
MESWIIRIVALFCAAGSAGLLWTFGVFIVVPWRDGRMLALNAAELQAMGVSLLLGLVTAWGALHIFALADRAARPKSYAMIRIVLIIAWLAACIGGILWTLGRIS